ncbi:metallophosphoesterase [Paenibacillus sp. NFR01]|uniref:metallophosphoesterase family protein n=1 Tax=Paenibacillus sp. NFR01 TaxID=1566279 RepID=UPI0008B2B3F4|nr:metallophosphoesterase family protein [Paenibacillus sp. NFR01]SET96964.1 Predicted phosphodiesterase [Paenibacillus sp. NFR01]
MQTIAILTDIHGNAPALQAVLNDIAKRGIKRMYCLGDTVGIGPDTDRIFELLLEQRDIAFVCGNHDLALLRAARGEAPPPGQEAERSHHEWLARRTDPRHVARMASWPMEILTRVEQVPVLLTHYHLDPDGWFQPVDWNPSTERLERQYAGHQARLVVFGHHHVVHHFTNGRRTFFNPGALGCAHSDRPVAAYGIVTIDGDLVSAEVIEVVYDQTDLLRAYAELDVPDNTQILRIFHGRDSH